MVTPVNLGPFPGYVGGGDGEIDVEINGLTNADDFAAIGTYHYGPDGFDRFNSGSFSVLQDATIETHRIGFELEQSSSASGEASPQVTVNNEVEFFFAVSADTSATLTMSYDGETNIGNDSVSLLVRRVEVGANPAVLETLFSTAVYPDDEGSDVVEIELLAGERYLIFMDSRARSFDGTGLVESALSVSIELPTCAADLNGDGLLDFFDVSAFLTAYNAMDPVADLNGDGLFNFFDVSGFLVAYNEGCP